MSIVFFVVAAPVAAVLLVSLARLLADGTQPSGNPRYLREVYRTFHP